MNALPALTTIATDAIRASSRRPNRACPTGRGPHRRRPASGSRSPLRSSAQPAPSPRPGTARPTEHGLGS